MVPPIISFSFNVMFGTLTVADYVDYAVRFGVPALLILTARRWVQHIGLAVLSMLMIAQIFGH